MKEKNSVWVENLTKKFGNFTAVDNISFKVKSGEIFGFLGANGAGKTTTIRMLCGLLIPTSGKGEVAGFNILKESELIKKRIGYMSQKFSLYDDLTVVENIKFFGGMYGLSRKEIDIKKDWILELANLKNMKNRITGDLAGGWKQRLALGTSLIHNPKIVFLDEPTAGVDPISRRNFWDIINNISDDGITVFVTTHYLDEAEYCNTIQLMDRGNIIAGGSPDKLKQNYIDGFLYQINTDNLSGSIDFLKNLDYLDNVNVLGTNINILTTLRKNDLKDRLLNKFNNKIKLISIKKIDPTLEDVFVNLIK